MEQKLVTSLEQAIEEALVKVVQNRGLERLPQRPSPRTMHLMAKAAVSVYEAAAEAHRERD